MANLKISPEGQEEVKNRKKLLYDELRENYQGWNNEQCNAMPGCVGKPAKLLIIALKRYGIRRIALKKSLFIQNLLRAVPSKP